MVSILLKCIVNILNALGTVSEPCSSSQQVMISTADTIDMSPSSSFANSSGMSIQRLFTELKLDILAVLTDDVKGNEDFMSALADFAHLAEEFTRLRDLYYDCSVFQRKQSQLKVAVDNANATLAEVRRQLSAISNIQVALSSGLTLGNMARAHEKLAIMTKLFQTLVVGKQCLRDAVRHLMRRNAGIMKRMTSFEPRNVQLECNNVALSWDDAQSQAEDVDISLAQSPTSCLSGYDLLNLFSIIQSESAVTARNLFEQAHISSTKINTTLGFNNCLQQLLNAAPILLLQQGENAVIVDVHQFVLDPEGRCLSDLLCLCEDKPDKCEDHNLLGEELNNSEDGNEEEDKEDTGHTVVQDTCSDDRSCHIGRPLKHQQIPQLISETIRFLELHGCAAHARRRSDATTSLGVTLEDLRKHLLKVIPVLQESGLSRTTVHELMFPPRQKTQNSKRYKGLVSARVGVKLNNLPQNAHEDIHFCSSQVKIAMEFGAKHDDKVAVMSADDMNKVNIGVPAVSRYHQLRHFFMSGDDPNLPDHDFPVTGGNKIVPSGYMFLKPRRTVLRRSSSADHLCGVAHCHRLQRRDPFQRRSRSLSPVRIRQSDGRALQVDKMGRLHYNCERSGPVYIFCRSVLFHPSSAFTHKQDLCQLADIAMTEGKSILTVVVDGGPDWTLKSMSTIMAMGRVWKDKDLDGLFWLRMLQAKASTIQ